MLGKWSCPFHDDNLVREWIDRPEIVTGKRLSI